MSRSQGIIPIIHEEIVKDTDQCTWIETKQIGQVFSPDILDLMEGMKKIQGEIRI